MDKEKTLDRLRKLSVLMDSKFTGPFGFKFGLDGLIGLVPFFGDFITTGMSLYIIAQSALLGCGPSVLLRMGFNVMLETLIGMIPVIGNIFDFAWKSNNKNVNLLELHTTNPEGATFRSRLVIGFITFTLLATMVGAFAVTILVLEKILEWISLFSS